MLPPVNGSGGATKPPSNASEVGQTTRPSVSPVGSRTHSESAPANLRPETREAIEPALSSPRSERLRTSGPDGNGLIEDLPAGPPPAFAETLLQRDARQALGPLEKVTAPASVEDRTRTETDTDARAYSEAKAGFEETREIATPDPEPKIDLKE